MEVIRRSLPAEVTQERSCRSSSPTVHPLDVVLTGVQAIKVEAGSETEFIEAAQLKQLFEGMEKLTQQVASLQEQLKHAETARDEARLEAEQAEEHHSNIMAVLEARLENALRVRCTGDIDPVVREENEPRPTARNGRRQSESSGVEVAAGGRSLEPSATIAPEEWVGNKLHGSEVTRHSTVQSVRGQNSLVSVIAKDSREGRDDVIASGEEWRFNHGLIRNSTEYTFEKVDDLFFLLNTRAIPFVGMGVEMTNSPSVLLRTAFRAFTCHRRIGDPCKCTHRGPKRSR